MPSQPFAPWRLGVISFRPVAGFGMRLAAKEKRRTPDRNDPEKAACGPEESAGENRPQVIHTEEMASVPGGYL